MLARLLLAHMAANVLGWIGITVAGTLVTLWPTILRTQIADGAERAAGRALPVLVGAVVVTVAGSVAGLRIVVVVGLAGYLAGWIVLAWPHARAWRRRPPHGFAAWSVLAALAWLGIGLVRTVGIVATSADWTVIAERLDALVVPFAVGFAAQVLLGALTYLIPVVLAGGPEAARRTIAVLETAALARVIGANVGLVLLGVPWSEPVRTAGWLLALVSMAAFLPIAAVGRHRRRTARGARSATRRAPTRAVRASYRSAWCVRLAGDGRHALEQLPHQEAGPEEGLDDAPGVAPERLGLLPVPDHGAEEPHAVDRAGPACRCVVAACHDASSRTRPVPLRAASRCGSR